MSLIQYSPLLLTFNILILCFFAYISAVIHDHVAPLFPYVSDAGSKLPQAAYFTLMLFITSILITIMGFYRFQQIKCIFSDKNLSQQISALNINRELALRLNKYAFVCAIILMISIAGIGSFRSSELIYAHLIAAIPLFFLTPALFMIHIWLSHILLPITGYNSLIVVKLRAIFTALAILSSILCAVFALFSMLGRKGKIDIEDYELRAHWKNSDGGYVAHCLSTFCEWLVFIFMSATIATFVPEFKRFKLHNGGVQFLYDNNNAIVSENNNETKV